MNESYQIIIVCVLINVQILSYASTGLTVMSILCIVMLTLTILVPLILLCQVKSNWKNLDQSGWKKSHGHLYNDLNIKNGPVVLLQPGFFLLRRLLLAIAVCLVGKVLIWQIFIMSG